MGWLCPPRQTTGDFLTSVTNPQERRPRDGYENKVPRTPDEFEAYWKNSAEFKTCLDEIDNAGKEDHEGKETLEAFRESRHQAQSRHVRPKSSYTVSTPMQVRLCMTRAYQRIWNDKASTLATIFAQIAQALIIGSVFFGTPLSTSSFFAKGSVLFFAVLLSALQSIVEINTLYAQRPVSLSQQKLTLTPMGELLGGIGTTH